MFNIHVWKAKPVEFADEEDGYSLASNYYKKKCIRGVVHYKITVKGLWKINEGRLCKDTHNFMVYLAGHGNRLTTDDTYENGDMR